MPRRPESFALKSGFAETRRACREIAGFERPEEVGAGQKRDDALVGGGHAAPPHPRRAHACTPPIEAHRDSRGNMAPPSRCGAVLSGRAQRYSGGGGHAPRRADAYAHGAASMRSRALRPPIPSAVLGLALALVMTILTTIPSLAQECTLVPDDRNPTEKVMRCGDNLTVRAAPGTRYRVVDQKDKEMPKALQLDSGALMVEFQGTDTQKDFQILTPHAIAAVRGTKWVVEVTPSRSSTLVISGRVAVKRPQAEEIVVLGPGQGVDVTPGRGPLVVNRWAARRVRALLARFGE
jgi:hypothetical protein